MWTLQVFAAALCNDRASMMVADTMLSVDKVKYDNLMSSAKVLRDCVARWTRSHPAGSFVIQNALSVWQQRLKPSCAKDFVRNFYASLDALDERLPVAACSTDVNVADDPQQIECDSGVQCQQNSVLLDHKIFAQSKARSVTPETDAAFWNHLDSPTSPPAMDDSPWTKRFKSSLYVAPCFFRTVGQSRALFVIIGVVKDTFVLTTFCAVCVCRLEVATRRIAHGSADASGSYTGFSTFLLFYLLHSSST